NTTKSRPASTPANTPAPEPRKITTVGSAEAMHINRKVDDQLSVIGDKNRSIRYAPGFRIQIYVGNERLRAENAKMQINQNFPELAPYLSYNQPTYKLKVGDFMRRIDAERYFGQIKQLISSAMLLPDKIDVHRSLSIK
ncbi:MAG: SPOR domain-containing protein, partial [Rudanella sp.]|nr:SPOR domain-containing protein [Rudanella sp.]